MLVHCFFTCVSALNYSLSGEYIFFGPCAPKKEYIAQTRTAEKRQDTKPEMPAEKPNLQHEKTAAACFILS
jgi:hypothetical protein